MHFENELHNEKQKTTKMKKQIELTVKARLFQGSFLLGILFLLNYVTPLALGQGESGNQSSTHVRAQWVWQNPPPQGNHLFGLSFTDANNGTAVGEDGTILRTRNGEPGGFISRVGQFSCSKFYAKQAAEARRKHWRDGRCPVPRRHSGRPSTIERRQWLPETTRATAPPSA